MEIKRRTTEIMQQLDLAEITTPSGEISRPIQVAWVNVPNRVELFLYEENDFLGYSDMSNPGASTRRTDFRGLLEEFIRLPNQLPGQFLTFARKWGRLSNQCTHRKPFEHCNLGCEDPHCEPLSQWLLISQVLKGVLNVAAKHHQEELGDKTDWRAIVDQEWFGYRRSIGIPEDNLAWEKSALGAIIDDLLYQSGARISFHWNSKEPRVSLAQDGCLFGVLVSYLVFAVARVEGIATCDSCGGIYAPSRKPQIERQHFCPECGPRAAKRFHARKKRIEKRTTTDWDSTKLG